MTDEYLGKIYKKAKLDAIAENDLDMPDVCPYVCPYTVDEVVSRNLQI